MEREESHRIRADQLATMVSGRLVGDPGASVSDVASLVSAGNEDLSFFADPRYLGLYDETKAGIVLLSEESEGIRTDLARIVVENPHESFMSVVRTFRPAPAPPDPGVHPEAVVDKTAKIDPTAFVGPCVVVEKGAHIGPHTVVRAGCYVGESVILGSHCCLEPSVVLYPGTKLGEGVVVASNTVIGADGFGFSRNEAGEWSEVPQTGGVLIADNVHIGAGVTIDRGTVDDTVIETGVKLDNQIHIAHNVVVGAHTVIAAQTGISGSTRIGAGNMIAGQVGIVGHIETVEGVIVEPQSGISKSIVRPGRYFGHPAKEHAVALRQEGAVRQLPELLREFRRMQRELKELREAVDVERVRPVVDDPTNL